MVIVNIEKTKVFNFNNITSISASGNQFFIDSEWLCSYANEDRAKEVLNQIIIALLNGESSYAMPKE